MPVCHRRRRHVTIWDVTENVHGAGVAHMIRQFSDDPLNSEIKPPCRQLARKINHGEAGMATQFSKYGVIGVNPSTQAQFDELLTYGAETLDLTPTDHEDAVQKYRAVGAWLSKSGSLLADSKPQIYPQGSMAIGTAVRPVGKDEFDLDLVCELQTGATKSPKELKNVIGQRLREHKLYGGLLKEKNRCWRLAYSGKFHMDILPACPNPGSSQGTALLIPDKELAAWKETDPKGYAAWFSSHSLRSASTRMEVQADVETPPPPPHTSTKTPLQLAVQILKRHRDLYFRGDEDAPISIIITTLAAEAYDGQASVLATLWHLLVHMPSLIKTDAAEYPVVRNPVNPRENFADKWRENPKKKQRFLDWIEAAKRDLEDLAGTSLPGMVRALTPLLGEHAGEEAMKKYGETIQGSRTAGLRATATTGALGITSAQARPIPRHTFYGRET